MRRSLFRQKGIKRKNFSPRLIEQTKEVRSYLGAVSLVRFFSAKEMNEPLILLIGFILTSKSTKRAEAKRRSPIIIFG